MSDQSFFNKIPASHIQVSGDWNESSEGPVAPRRSIESHFEELRDVVNSLDEEFAILIKKIDPVLHKTQPKMDEQFDRDSSEYSDIARVIQDNTDRLRNIREVLTSVLDRVAL